MPEKRDETDNPIKLDDEFLNAHSSPYLNDGYKRDRFLFKNVTVAPNQIHAELNLEASFASPRNGEPHLSLNTALIMLSQLGIFYVGWDLNYDKKIGETYMRHIDIKCARPILSQKIHIDVTIKRKSTFDSNVLYSADFSFCENLFTGKTTIVQAARSPT